MRESGGKTAARLLMGICMKMHLKDQRASGTEVENEEKDQV